MSDNRRKRDEEFSLSRLKDLFFGTGKRRLVTIGFLVLVVVVPPVQTLLLQGAGALIRYLASMIVPILALVAIYLLARNPKR